MFGDFNMIIKAGSTLFPFSMLEGLGWERFEGRLVQRLKQLPARGTKMLGDLVVEDVQ